MSDPAAQVHRIGVAGAGTMGAGIAQVAAQSGYEVTLYDISDQVLTAALDRIEHFIRRSAEKGRIESSEAEAAVARLQGTTDLVRLAAADLVIEAAPERIEIKQTLFQSLEPHLAADALLATNTSTLSVTRIGAALDRPARLGGMHFFNPAPLMPLVEVVRGAATAPEVIETLVGVAERMGKVPVRARDLPGFIVNRVARPFHLEALRVVEEGVTDPATVDRLLRDGAGFRMGPFELQDLIGIDINFTASQSVYEAFQQAPRFRPSPLQQRQVESGHLGRKRGRGWYRYE